MSQAQQECQELQVVNPHPKTWRGGQHGQPFHFAWRRFDQVSSSMWLLLKWNAANLLFLITFVVARAKVFVKKRGLLRWVSPHDVLQRACLCVLGRGPCATIKVAMMMELLEVGMTAGAVLAAVPLIALGKPRAVGVQPGRVSSCITGVLARCLFASQACSSYFLFEGNDFAVQ